MSLKTSKKLSLDTFQLRNHGRMVGTTVVLLLFVVGFFTIRKIEMEVKKITQGSLEITLKANAESLLQWLNSKENEITIISENQGLVDLALVVYSEYSQRGFANVKDLPEYQAFHQKLGKLRSHSDYKHFYLLDHQYRIILSSDERFVGIKIDDLGQDIKNTIEANQAYIRLPKYTIFDTKRKGTPYLNVARKLQTPVGHPAITLALSIEPEKSFSRVLQASRSGETAETYAINKNGYMISNSRFVEELKSSGILKQDDQTSVLKVKLVKDDNQPTKMAQSALSGNAHVIYPKYRSDVEGYLDYRGVEVIGAWTFLENYGFAIATEIDLDEAYQSLDIIKFNYRCMLALALLFGIAVIVYSRKAVKMQLKARYAMNEVKELGQYNLLEKIGEGGMGVVYKAEHKLIHRETALKLLKPGVSTDHDIKLFEKEVRLTCKLNHPNTICIYDYGKTAEGSFYYVMEYLDGMDLATMVKRHGPMEPSRVIYFLKQICGSLKEAHNCGLVHRDIKGQNIISCNKGGNFDFIKVLGRI